MSTQDRLQEIKEYLAMPIPEMIQSDLSHCVSVFKMTPWLLAEIERKDNALQELPEKLRAQLEGHKGQAFRIATQLCQAALSSSQE